MFYSSQNKPDFYRSYKMGGYCLLSDIATSLLVSRQRNVSHDARALKQKNIHHFLYFAD